MIHIEINLIKDENQQSLYAEHPLNVGSSDNTRLSRILPSPIFDTSWEPIKIEIETVALKDAPPYIALSYVWGTVDHPESVVLGGRNIRVRFNLWKFLDSIQCKRETIHFWIDALCIDQGSSSERSHQVAMMGQIYSRAAKVIVWLGSDPKLLGLIASSLSRPHDKDWSEFVDAAWYSTFVDAEYWRRVWTIQEFFLPQYLEIRYGGVIVSPEIVDEMIETVFILRDTTSTEKERLSTGRARILEMHITPISR